MLALLMLALGFFVGWQIRRYRDSILRLVSKIGHGSKGD